MLPALTLLVLAVTPASAINGGTPEQRFALKVILDRLPECFTAAGGTPIAVKIVSGTGPQAVFDNSTGTLNVDATLLDPGHWAENSRDFREDMCALPGEIRWMGVDTRRVVLHELAHALHRRGATGRRLQRGAPESVLERLEGFFQLRFDQEFEIWSTDPVRLELETQLNAALEEAKAHRARRQAVPSSLLQEICDLHSQLREMYQPSGLPSRFGNDRHAVKEPEVDLATGTKQRGGAEFFAIAVETLVADHRVFCKHFTPEEQAWLAEEIGGCLSGLPGKAPCYPDPNRTRTAPPAAGAGMRRD